MEKLCVQIEMFTLGLLEDEGDHVSIKVWPSMPAEAEHDTLPFVMLEIILSCLQVAQMAQAPDTKCCSHAVSAVCLQLQIAGVPDVSRCNSCSCLFAYPWPA